MEYSEFEFTAKDIWAGYGKREVLKGASLNIAKGEIVSVVGKNGAGKSTFLKAVMGMLPVSQGSIYYRGEDIAKMKVNERFRRGICFFMQGGQVFPSLSFDENIQIATLTMDRRTRTERKHELMATFFPEVTISCLTGLFNRNSSLLSDGEKSMLSLMMVLMNIPKFLMLDEPSAGLSPENTIKFYRSIIEFVERYETTILIVEQNVKLAVEMADRICLISDGIFVREEQTAQLKDGSLNAHPGKLENFLLAMD